LEADVHLVRDLLDKAVIDRNGRDMGRVDRVVLEVGDGSPPRVVSIEVGASALGHRLGRRCGRWVAGLLHACGVDDGQPLRIHVSQILGVTDTVKVDLAFGETSAANVERKARRFVGALPGAER
jgi:sporulation protein YlmC with PRC-barrel domain